MVTDLLLFLKENKIKSVLLIEPAYPHVSKSRNHSNFCPIGLLKICSLLKKHDISFKLVSYDIKNSNSIQNCLNIDKNYDLIMVTSLFTYYSKYVKEVVSYCKNNFPKTPVMVGGIYASLLPEHCKEYTDCDYVYVGLVSEAEELIPSYELVDVDYQILHTSRGCIRRCGFCGTYKLEPEQIYLKSVKHLIVKKRLVFYDNNLLANPYVEDILKELIELKNNRQINYCESQSGFDGRILQEKPHLAKLIYEAGFKNPKIAWDGAYSEKENIQKQIQLLIDSGYQNNKIGVFMLYNFDLDYEELERKRVAVFNMGCMIMDCRYRPLTQTFDEYNPFKEQDNTDYYINPNWSDTQIKTFKRNVRYTNICIMFKLKYFCKELIYKQVTSEEKQMIKKYSFEELKEKGYRVWNPAVLNLECEYV